MAPKINSAVASLLASPIEQKLYDTIKDEGGENINFKKKVKLEKQLQSEN